MRCAIIATAISVGAMKRSTHAFTTLEHLLHLPLRLLAYVNRIHALAQSSTLTPSQYPSGHGVTVENAPCH